MENFREAFRVKLLAELFILSSLKFFLMSSALASTAPTLLDFNLDYDQETITVPEANCRPLLDDAVNFYVEKSGEKTYRVGSNKISEKSGSLLFDCPSEPIFIVLKYKNIYSDKFEQNRRRTFDRPKSEVTIDYFKSPFDETFGLSAYDMSFDKFQLMLNSSLYSLNAPFGRTQGIDISHKFGEFKFGYGNSFQSVTDKSRYSYRSNISYYSYLLNYEFSQSPNRKVDSSRLFAHFDEPLNINYSFFDNKEGIVAHSIQKSFNRRSVAWLLSYDFGLQFLQKEHEKNTSQLNNNLTFIRYLSSNSEIEDSNIVDCDSELSQKCLWKKTGFALSQILRWPLQSKNKIEYRPFPHSINIESKTNFLYKQYFDVKLEKYFQPIPFFSKFDWIDNSYPASDELYQQCSLNLEYWFSSFNAGTKLPLCPTFKKEYSAISLGADFQYPSWALAANYLFYPFDKKNWQANATARYYFEKNLNYFNYTAFENHKVTGRLLANGLREPVANSRLELFDVFGALVQTALSDENGNFVFNNIPAKGTFSILPSGDEKTNLQDFVKELTKPNIEVIVTKIKYQPTYFRFFEQGGLKEVDLKNYFSEVDESMLYFEGAKNRGDISYLEIGKTYEIKVHDYLLPANYKIQKLEFESITAKDQNPLEIKVFLTREKS